MLLLTDFSLEDVFHQIVTPPTVSTVSKKPMNDPASPLSPPSPKKKVRQFGAVSFDTDDEGFQVPHNGMASRDILDRELIANVATITLEIQC